MARLGDTGKIITGNTPKTSEALNYSSNDICFVKPSDILDGEITVITDSEFYISNHARDKARILPPKSVLVTCIGIIGKVAINNVECAFNQQINAIVPDTTKCLTEYLAYAIQNKQIEMQDIANAPVVPILNKTQFSEIEIQLPSVESQAEVVKKMRAVDVLISLRKQQLSKLDELVKSRFVELFGDPVDNPMEWATKQLQELVTDDCTISYGIVQTGDDQEEGIPVLRPVDIVNRIPVRSELKKTTEEISNKYKRTILKGREMLITVRANIADTCIVGEEFAGCNVGRGIVPIRTKETEMILEFLKYQIDSKHLNDSIKALAKGITLIQLNMEDLREVTLIVPPIEKQKSFVEFAKQTDKSKLSIQQSLEKLETLKKALMQKYFG